MICKRTFVLEVDDPGPPPFDCLGNPSTIATAIWAQTPFQGQPPCATITAVGGVGTFDLNYEIPMNGPCINNGMVLKTTICNSGAAYDVTFTAPWSASGSIAVGFSLVTVSMFINGVLQGPQSQDQRDLITGPFTDFSVVGSLPQGASNTIEIQVALLCFPDPLVSVFSTGNFAITPLAPP
jgi:hypothetical protein